MDSQRGSEGREYVIGASFADKPTTTRNEWLSQVHAYLACVRVAQSNELLFPNKSDLPELKSARKNLFHFSQIVSTSVFSLTSSSSPLSWA